jgi:hypothetical protein
VPQGPPTLSMRPSGSLPSGTMQVISAGIADFLSDRRARLEAAPVGGGAGEPPRLIEEGGHPASTLPSTTRSKIDR